MLVDLPVPCSIHFQRADQLGLHSLYVPPPSLWTPVRSRQGITLARRLLAGKQRSWQEARAGPGDMAPVNDSYGMPGRGVPQRKIQRRSVTSRRQPLRAELQAMGVDNSVICITLGSSIVWELQDGVYPVYVEVGWLLRTLKQLQPFISVGRGGCGKVVPRDAVAHDDLMSRSGVTNTMGVCPQDSLLNSSTNFDSTGFRALAMSEGATLEKRKRSFFIHTFASEGAFVFASSTNISRVALVRVVSPGTDCPGDTG